MLVTTINNALYCNGCLIEFDNGFIPTMYTSYYGDDEEPDYDNPMICLYYVKDDAVYVAEFILSSEESSAIITEFDSEKLYDLCIQPQYLRLTEHSKCIALNSYQFQYKTCVHESPDGEYVFFIDSHGNYMTPTYVKYKGGEDIDSKYIIHDFTYPIIEYIADDLLCSFDITFASCVGEDYEYVLRRHNELIAIEYETGFTKIIIPHGNSYKIWYCNGSIDVSTIDNIVPYGTYLDVTIKGITYQVGWHSDLPK